MYFIYLLRQLWGIGTHTFIAAANYINLNKQLHFKCNINAIICTKAMVDTNGRTIGRYIYLLYLIAGAFFIIYIYVNIYIIAINHRSFNWQLLICVWYLHNTIGKKKIQTLVCPSTINYLLYFLIQRITVICVVHREYDEF